MRAEADGLATELLSLGPKLATLAALFGTEGPSCASLSRALGREAELLSALEEAPDTPWVVAARAIGSAEWNAAVTALARIGCAPAEAYAHLRTAEELVHAGRAPQAEGHVKAALAFYKSVGATHFVQKAHALAADATDTAGRRNRPCLCASRSCRCVGDLDGRRGPRHLHARNCRTRVFRLQKDCVPNAELFVYRGEAHYFAEHDQQAAVRLHRRALDFLQALVRDEFRAARRSHTYETTGRCVVRRRVRDERAAAAIQGGEVSSP
jgi:hypothetical protein